MRSIKTRCTTNELGRPLGWNEAVHGPCDSLPVVVGQYNGLRQFQSYWQPDAAELEALRNGGSVRLGIVSDIHPPVIIEVMHAGEKDLTGPAPEVTN